MISIRYSAGVFLAGAVAAAGVVSLAPSPAHAFNCADYHVANIVRLTNEYRESKGLEALGCDQRLVEDSQAWADFLRAQGDLEHAEGDFAENIAWFGGEVGPEQVVDEWIESPAHRANILDEGASLMGAGWSHGESEGTYAVQRFE
ncbi:MULTISPECIES: CAP domain-containing protein [unclassified Corynebacterium]|uniref:CAP domain-containing protein n=1 Tax=unclassified Corynebacterium TaxID=2624378 RepID=UPI0029C9D53E|nr:MULTISPECIES: CAP domain-containing protein [unclassified Corynebacterium]WPF66798.1 CAP domain-containing protein [Corynebacterium sp. 22KM0430]WPF69286.1 CAP domain-containing protein [Corynebacterium sp. 21KM1197]